MLTPRFSCEQDDQFITVYIHLVNECKLSGAQFEITERRFIFYCRPYYLRLTFDVELTECAGERAVFDLATSILKVSLPKLVKGARSERLDDPAFLIATDRQRRRMVEPVNGDDSEDVDEVDHDYVQQTEPTDAVAQRGDHADVTYGFNSDFGPGLFGGNASVDGPLSHRSDAVDLPSPDTTPTEQRRSLREAEENRLFDERAVTVVIDTENEEDAELVEVYSYRPWYVVSFEAALETDGVRFVHPRATLSVVPRDPGDIGSTLRRGVGEEEDEVPLILSGRAPITVCAWEGNIGTFDPPAEATDTAADPTKNGLLAEPTAPVVAAEDLPVAAQSVGASHSPSPLLARHRRQLACPTRKPGVLLSAEETDTLARVPSLGKQSAGVNATSVMCLAIDVLLAYVYDELTTLGAGSSESLWTVWKLSSCLCWLDEFEAVDDVVVAFARRVLTFPLHRSFDLAARCVRDVGILLLSGRTAVLKSLARVKALLDHSEGKYVLSTLFLNPLIEYLLSEPLDNIERWLEQGALQLHDVMVPSSQRLTPRRIDPYHRIVRHREAALSIEFLGLPLTPIDSD